MLLQQALDPEKIEFRVADSRPKRDYLHVDDLIALLLACYKRGAQGVFNAGSGHSTSVSELVDLLNTLTPRPKPLVTENRQRPNEVLDVVADISKARRELAWHPRVPLGEGIARMLVGLQAERGGR